MTGMKEGSGDDPFADPISEPEIDDTDDEPAIDAETTETPNDTEATTQSTSQQLSEIPMILRRDSVHSGRNRVPLFLQQDTQREERDALRELEDQFDGDVALTDLREALVMSGLEHLDDVEEQLREWGYGLTFD